jgi:uncharacterized membrane protein (DUF4010 family)
MFETFSRLAIALGLGLLVGLQRQRTDARLAGFRTFPLVALLGALCGLAAENFGGWIVAGGFAALALIIIGGDLPLLHVAEESPGITTEVAMLLMFTLGAYLMVGSTTVGIVVCGAVAVLLHLKPQMHSLAKRIGDRDFTAIMQFALISLVILPVLPDRVYGPFDILNPFRIWLMVVLIVAISLGGYIVYKLLGDRAGAWSTGLLGGLISSTATTVSLARRSKESAARPESTAFAIMIASAVVFLRLAILIGMTAPRFLSVTAVPLAAMFLVLAGFGWLSYHRRETGRSAIPDQSNPSELKPAILFGSLYAVVLVAVAAANEYFGTRGLYVTAMISGLTDMDAITLSVTHLVAAEGIGPGTGWRLIVIAALANLVFKAATVVFLGDRRLWGFVAVGFGATFAVGMAFLAFGP